MELWSVADKGLRGTKSDLTRNSHKRKNTKSSPFVCVCVRACACARVFHPRYFVHNLLPESTGTQGRPGVTHCDAFTFDPPRSFPSLSTLRAPDLTYRCAKCHPTQEIRAGLAERTHQVPGRKLLYYHQRERPFRKEGRYFAFGTFCIFQSGFHPAALSLRSHLTTGTKNYFSVRMRSFCQSPKLDSVAV